MSESLDEPRGVRRGALALAVLLNGWTDVRLLGGHAYLDIVSWLASLALLVHAIPGESRAREDRPSAPRRVWLGRAALVLLPALVRLADVRLDRIHSDDMLTGYFSATYDLRHTDFFAPVPANPGDWVTQFPAPFFVLQKLFFLVFGESLLTVKLSILPYVVVVAALLYAIARELLDERAAALAVIVYAFFGPSLYLETLGLHFVSSTAAFLAFFYLAIRELRTGDRRTALLAGLAAAACYLFYLSSFVALPLAAVCFFVRGAAERERHVGRNLALFSLAVVAVLGPFACDAVKEPNAFFRRFEQVSLLGGEWSNAGQRIAHGESRAHILWSNATDSFRSLYHDGIGGCGGYDFGKQALLEPVALVLVIVGVVRALTLARRRGEWWLLLVSVALFFLTDLVLSIPPPAFHRFSIAFPFLALLIALPLDGLAASSLGSARFRASAIAAVLAGFIVVQQLYFLRAARPENEYVTIRLARFINELFPGRPLYVAAFRSFAFEKVYYFAPNRRAPRVRSDYHATLLPKLNPREKYVYVVTLPDRFDEQFERQDPKGRIIRFAPDYSVFVN